MRRGNDADGSEFEFRKFSSGVELKEMECMAGLRFDEGCEERYRKKEVLLTRSARGMGVPAI